MFGHNMKLSMILTCSPSQFSHFRVWKIPSGLKNTCQKRGFSNQRWNKSLDMFPNSNKMRISILTTSWVVISHSKYWTINWKNWSNQTRISQLALQNSQRIPNTSGYLDHLCEQTIHPCWAYSLRTRSTGSHRLAHTLDKGMMPTHFYLQGQP